MVDKLQNTARGKKSDWRIAFKEGVEIDKKVLQETFSSQPAEEDYRERYDLSFLTPQGRSIRCKVEFATLETRSNLGRVASRSRLWDRYWGRVIKLAAILSPVTIPQAFARCDSSQIASRF